eukprot:1564942-Pleurochrysis_carterae.AAC.1
MRVRVRACVRGCVRACMRVRVRPCMRVRVCPTVLSAARAGARRADRGRGERRRAQVDRASTHERAREGRHTAAGIVHAYMVSHVAAVLEYACDG